MNRILFVCVGNICRSPALKGVLAHLVAGRDPPVEVESCGLDPTFLGRPPDLRMQEVAMKHGFELKDQAKLFDLSYFDRFDAIFCVNQEVISHICSLTSNPQHLRKVFMATEFAKECRGQPIPDPYYCAMDGFEQVWGLIEEACQGIVAHFFPSPRKT